MVIAIRLERGDMETQARSRIEFRVTYDGVGPVFWNGEPASFGLQDQLGVLHQGALDADGAVSFAFSLDVKPGRSDAPVFLGPFAQGPPAKRFLYLGWRNRDGAFAQRISLPLGSIGWDLIRSALSSGDPLVCRLIDKHPRATSTGANIGGARHVAWTVGTRNG